MFSPQKQRLQVQPQQQHPLQRLARRLQPPRVLPVRHGSVHRDDMSRTCKFASNNDNQRDNNDDNIDDKYDIDQ